METREFFAENGLLDVREFLNNLSNEIGELEGRLDRMTARLRLVTDAILRVEGFLHLKVAYTVDPVTQKPKYTNDMARKAAFEELRDSSMDTCKDTVLDLSYKDLLEESESLHNDISCVSVSRDLKKRSFEIDMALLNVLKK
jgi:hypothetical protein